jgi:hypothetical protein
MVRFSCGTELFQGLVHPLKVDFVRRKRKIWYLFRTWITLVAGSRRWSWYVSGSGGAETINDLKIHRLEHFSKWAIGGEEGSISFTGAGMQILGKSILLILFLAVLGCAAGAQRQLLQVDDWRTMPDDELLSYYFALNEEIDRCEARRTRGTIGLGTGIGTGRTRFGVGITQGVTGCNTERLRERRAIVRSELRSRGLIQ